MRLELQVSQHQDKVMSNLPDHFMSIAWRFKDGQGSWVEEAIEDERHVVRILERRQSFLQAQPRVCKLPGRPFPRWSPTSVLESQSLRLLADPLVVGVMVLVVMVVRGAASG